MPYRILERECVGDAIRRTSREQIQWAIDEIDGGLDVHEVVHQVRRRCKKIRAVLRLARHELGATYAKENTRFRDAAKDLSALRDSTALIETFDRLMESVGKWNGTASFASIRSALESRRMNLMARDQHAAVRLAAFRAEMEQAWTDVDRWRVRGEGYAVVRAGLLETYGRGRKAFRRAYSKPSVERFHELRKYAKYHWYHMRLLQDSCTPIISERRRHLRRIVDLLGDAHDLDILEAAVRIEFDPPGMRQPAADFLRIVSRRRFELQSVARVTAERLYAEHPHDLADRFQAYWKSWRHASTVT